MLVTFFLVVTFFARLVLIQSIQFFGAVQINFHYAFFLLTILNVYGHQICQGGDILRGASTHKFT